MTKIFCATFNIRFFKHRLSDVLVSNSDVHLWVSVSTVACVSISCREHRLWNNSLVRNLTDRLLL